MSPDYPLTMTNVITGWKGDGFNSRKNGCILGGVSMLSRCTQIFTLDGAPVIIWHRIADSKPAVIYGNAYGLWSPTHPHLTFGRDKPRSPVRYTPFVTART